MTAPARLALAGGLLAVLLGAAVAADAWARGPGTRAARRPAARGRVVELRPAVVRHYAPTAPLTRGASAARALLGVALVTGVVLHLRRAGRARPVACTAALLGAAWALGTGFERATRAFDVPYVRITVGTQAGGFTLHDAWLALAVLLAAAAGLAAAVRRPAAARPPDPASADPAAGAASADPAASAAPDTSAAP